MHSVMAERLHLDAVFSMLDSVGPSWAELQVRVVTCWRPHVHFSFLIIVVAYADVDLLARAFQCLAHTSVGLVCRLAQDVALVFQPAWKTLNRSETSDSLQLPDCRESLMHSWASLEVRFC